MMNRHTEENTRDWWRRAEREGRLSPGNGPEYTRRILPNRVPFLRARILEDRQATRHRLETTCRTVAPGVLVLPLPEDTPHQVRGDDPGRFLVDIVTRARAQHLRYASAVLGFWGALAFHGLLYWADSAPVVLLQDRHRTRPMNSARAADRPTVPVFRHWLPGSPRDVCRPDPKFPDLLCVTAPVATAQCLRTVLDRNHTWPVPVIPGLLDFEVRAVQLIDAVLQCTTATLAEIEDACRGTVGERRLRPLLALVDHGAQSPRETLLRLLLREALPEGFHWSSQVPVTWGRGRGTSTVLDLACEELRIAVYYDGGTHAAAEQTAKDIDQIQELRDLWWEVLRVDAELFRSRDKLMRLVKNMVARAVAAHAVRSVDGV